VECDYLSGKVVLLRVDNTAAVAWLNKHRLNHMWGQREMRLLTMVSLRCNIKIMCKHIPGDINTVADDLSLCTGNIAAAAPEWFRAAARANLQLEGEVVDAMWRDRVMSGMAGNTYRAYTSAFVGYFNSMQWEAPYLRASVGDDLLRVVSWINHLAVDKGLAGSTINSYLTGTKQLLSLHLIVSEALSLEKDARHEVINLPCTRYHRQ
jgi:hypothetical protein